MTKPKSKKKVVMITLREAAQRTKMSTSLLRVYCKLGAFPSAEKKRGTRWLISESDIDDVVHDRIDFSGLHKKG